MEQDTTSQMERDASSRPTWWQMTVGGVISMVVNLGYVALVNHDQRMLLMMFLTVAIGMGLLLGLRTGAYGMGVILGSAGAMAVVGVLVIFFDVRFGR